MQAVFFSNCHYDHPTGCLLCQPGSAQALCPSASPSRSDYRLRAGRGSVNAEDGPRRQDHLDRAAGVQIAKVHTPFGAQAGDISAGELAGRVRTPIEKVEGRPVRRRVIHEINVQGAAQLGLVRDRDLAERGQPADVKGDRRAGKFKVENLR